MPDGIGQVTRITDANNGITTFQYDAASNLQSVTDAKNNPVVRNTYDMRNRVVSVCDALHNCTAYSNYDSDDNLLTGTDGAGIEDQFPYDNLNRTTEIDYGVFDGTPTSLGQIHIRSWRSIVSGAGLGSRNHNPPTRAGLFTDRTEHHARQRLGFCDPKRFGRKEPSTTPPTTPAAAPL